MNKVFLTGRLTDNVKPIQTQKTLLGSFRLASKDMFSTEFIDCTAFGKTAEFLCKYSKKGDWVYVVGKVTNRKFIDKSGATKYITSVAVESVELPKDKQEPQAQAKLNIDNVFESAEPLEETIEPKKLEEEDIPDWMKGLEQ